MPKRGIQDIFAALEKDRDRLGMIVGDVLTAVKSGCFPLVLTGRREQVDEFEAKLTENIKNVLILRGGLGRKQRREPVTLEGRQRRSSHDSAATIGGREIKRTS